MNDYPPLDVDFDDLHDRLTKNVGRPISLDEWGLIITGLRIGKSIVIQGGKIYLRETSGHDLAA
jgi:hypothetical protein